MNKDKQRKKWLSLLLVLAMLFTLLPTAGLAAPQSSYSDVSSSSWYAAAVDYVTENNLMVGVADGTFSPDGIVTRAMVITVLWRQAGTPSSTEISGFSDVKASDWYVQAVNWGVENGLVAGYSADTFGPNDPVTREQLMVFLCRFAEFNGETIGSIDQTAMGAFTDWNKVSDWAKGAMAWAYQKGLISGTTATTLAGQDTANRAQFAVILMRAGSSVGSGTGSSTSEKTPAVTGGGGGSSSSGGSGSSNTTINLSQYSHTSYYYNGTIITVDEKDGEDSGGNPIYAKAVIAGDGVIVAVAYSDADAAVLERSANRYNSDKVDLAGKTMLPAFVDAHSHIDMVDQYYDASPSSGVISLAKLVENGKRDLANWVSDDTYNEAYGEITTGGAYWFVTNGYDNTAFEVDRFAMPTKDVLDQISTEYPICYIHASNHLAAVNSLGLEILERTAPDGMKSYWDKDATGDYTGILRETGFYILYMNPAVLSNSRISRTATKSGVIANAMKVYASNGITTAVSGSGSDQASVMAGVPEADRIIDVQNMVSYTEDNKNLFGTTNSATSQYNEFGMKYGGIKIFLDGSPQGKTAWFAEDLTDTVSGGGYYRGADEVLLDNTTSSAMWWYASSTAEGRRMGDDSELIAQFADLINSGLQFTCHANGTGAIQQYIDCYRAALIQCGIDVNDPAAIAAVNDKVRPVIIHGQTVTHQQLEECSKLGINISFFTDHVYYYGDYHLYSTLGPVRGQVISPMASALADGMNLNITMHQDSPVAPPNMLFSVYNAVNRITRDGQAIGRGSYDGSSDHDSRITDWKNKADDTRDERVSAYAALKCVTINNAWQNFEEDTKGSIAVQKQADFVILNVNPLSEEFLGLGPLEAKNGSFVVKTINNDKVIYEK